MQAKTGSDLLALAFFARSAGNPAEARAAAIAAAHVDPARIEAWLLLLEMDAQEARWEQVLDIVNAAVVHHRHNAVIALYRPRALLALARRTEAAAELARVAREYPDSIDALELLAQMMWPLDPPTCVDAVEQAVARGMAGRDYLIATAIDAAVLMGAFDRGHALVAAMGDAGARERAGAKLTVAETAWRAHERDYDARLAAGTVAPIWALIDAGEVDFARYVGTRRLLEDCPAAELEQIILAAHRMGIAGSPLLGWAAYATNRHPERPATMLSYVDVLLATGAFADAGAMLRTMSVEDVPVDELLRRQTFCCACGGLEPEVVVQTLLAADAARPDLVALARAFLSRNQRPEDTVGGFDRLDPRGATLRAQETVDPGQALRRFLRPAPSRRPRVALSVSGQLRSYRQTWPQTREAFARFDPVVFVSTWSGVGAGFGAHDTVERCLPPGVLSRLPPELRRRSLFEAALPRTSAVMAASDTVTREELQDFYGTEFVRVHDEAAFEEAHAGMPGLLYGNSLNQAKMFFTMADVSSLRSAYELETFRMFDAVMRIRPDRAITHVGDRDIETVLTSRALLSDYFMIGGIGDQGMLSSTEVADRLGEIWPKMLAAGSTRFFPGSSGQFNEFLIAEYMMHSGVDLRRLTNTHSMGLTPIIAPVAPMWQAIVTDYAGQDTPAPEVASLFTAFCEAAAEEHAATGAAELVQPLPAVVVERVVSGLSDRARAFVEAAPRA